MATTGSDVQADPEALAAELEAIRRRVLNVIGHELRTPVTTLHGLATEVALAEDLDLVHDHLAPALVRNAERLTTLLDDLLVAAGVRTAIPVDSPGAMDLAAAIGEIWAGLSAEPLEVEGDAVGLTGPLESVRRALLAVLENAAAYGTAPPRVAVVDDGAQVAVTVDSPGPALHPEEVRLATQPFFRGERAVTSRPGLGMGLAIAEAVIEQAGGTLRFEAVPDGTRTVITLTRSATG